MVCSILERTTKHVAIEEKTQTQQVKYYNPDAILAEGYPDEIQFTQQAAAQLNLKRNLKSSVVRNFRTTAIDKKWINQKRRNHRGFSNDLEIVKSGKN